MNCYLVSCWNSFQMIRFFLSLTAEGKQTFLTQEGEASGLLQNAPVYTHHASLSSGYTMDPGEVVIVNRLPASSMLSDPAILKMIFPDGNEAIRAQLGYLDMEVAPEEPELAMVMGFFKGQIKRHGFLVGGKSVSLKISLSSLEGLCNDIDATSEITLGVDFTSIQFPLGRKATQWRKIEEMFKDASFGEVDFSKAFVYARWRVLELKTNGKDKLMLSLEVLPLDKALDNHDAEMITLYNSSSNKAIALYSWELKWRSPNERLRLFTTPCLIMMDGKEGVVTDSMIRLSMATVRDSLRSGFLCVGAKEGKAAIDNPQIFAVWGRSRRALFMQEVEALEVIRKGKYVGVLSLVQHSNSRYCL